MFVAAVFDCLLLGQGPETDMGKVDKLCKLSQKGYASSMVVTNRNKKVRVHCALVCSLFFLIASRQSKHEIFAH